MRKPLRYLLAVVLWLPVHLHDRLTGVRPAASFRRGLDWARGVHEPTIRAARGASTAAPRPVRSGHRFLHRMRRREG